MDISTLTVKMNCANVFKIIFNGISHLQNVVIPRLFIDIAAWYTPAQFHL